MTMCLIHQWEAILLTQTFLHLPGLFFSTMIPIKQSCLMLQPTYLVLPKTSYPQSKGQLTLAEYLQHSLLLIISTQQCFPLQKDLMELFINLSEQITEITNQYRMNRSLYFQTNLELLTSISLTITKTNMLRLSRFSSSLPTLSLCFRLKC